MTIKIRDWNKIYENNRTRELKKLEWVPVPNRMDGSGYSELVDHPNGAAHLGAWVAILEIASRCRIRGTLVKGVGTIPQEGAGECGAGNVAPQEGAGECAEDPLTLSDLARMSRLPLSVFEEVLPRLRKIKWIEVSGESTTCEDHGTIPQEGAGECGAYARDARARTELNGMEENRKEKKQQAAGDPPSQPTPIRVMPPIRTGGMMVPNSDWPLVAAATFSHFQTSNEPQVQAIAAAAIRAWQNVPEPKIPCPDDAVVAAAVEIAFKEKRGRQENAGLFVLTVPEVVRNWCKLGRPRDRSFYIAAERDEQEAAITTLMADEPRMKLARAKEARGHPLDKNERAALERLSGKAN